MSSDARALAIARFRTTLELCDAGVEMMRQKIVRDHPGASPAEIDRLLGEWLRVRPGAEHGDAAGTPGTWPRTPKPGR
jgi:hypothetical protein